MMWSRFFLCRFNRVIRAPIPRRDDKGEVTGRADFLQVIYDSLGHVIFKTARTTLAGEFVIVEITPRHPVHQTVGRPPLQRHLEPLYHLLALYREFPL